jgi:hypothetical protein
MTTKTSKTPLVLIDSDPIVYRCGFAAETPYYDLVVEHKTDDRVEHLHFEPVDKKSAGDRMNAWIEANSDWTVIDKVRGANPGPVEHALKAVREQMDSIQRECDAWLGTKCNVQLYLSGHGNFREELATLKPYKGNRDALHKPVHYQSIRDYLVHEWKAAIITGREADDEVSIVARRLARQRLPFVIATIDKDLDQIPGRHYNYMKKVRYVVDAEEAMAWFYTQCLSGDATDNIGGCYKVGGVKATSIVNDVLVEFEGAETEDIEQALWEAVLDAYSRSYEVPGCPYVDKELHAVALENARLVKMQEYEGQLWNPPGEPDELLP